MNPDFRMKILFLILLEANLVNRHTDKVDEPNLHLWKFSFLSSIHHRLVRKIQIGIRISTEYLEKITQTLE